MENSYNPFAKNTNDYNFTVMQLSEILRWGMGFDSRKCEFMPLELVKGYSIMEATDDPVIIDKDGESHHYQRGLVWTVEEQRQLIDSIYDFQDIGKFVVVRHSFKKVLDKAKAGHKNLAFHEVLDGKQRLNAIISFMQDKFPDRNGMYYSQLSDAAKRTFRGFNKSSLAMLEDVDASTIKDAFIRTNSTGRPVSQEHLERVKSINLA